MDQQTGENGGTKNSAASVQTSSAGYGVLFILLCLLLTVGVTNFINICSLALSACFIAILAWFGKIANDYVHKPKEISRIERLDHELLKLELQMEQAKLKGVYHEHKDFLRELGYQVGCDEDDAVDEAFRASWERIEGKDESSLGGNEHCSGSF